MTQQDIQEKVIQFMVDRLEYDETRLTPEVHLKEDLGMTSLDAVETSLFIRRTFGFQPERGAIKTIGTLQELCDFIAHNLPQ